MSAPVLVLAAQAPAPAPEPVAPPRLLVYVDQQAGGNLTQSQVTMISRSILLGLQSGIDSLSFAEEAGGSIALVSADGLSDLAAKAGAQYWLWAQVSTGSDHLQLRVRGYDVRSREAKMDTTLDRTGAFSALALPFEHWDDLVANVRASFPVEGTPTTAAARTPGAPRNATLLVRAVPGTVVTTDGGRKATVGGDGLALLGCLPRRSTLCARREPGTIPTPPGISSLATAR